MPKSSYHAHMAKHLRGAKAPRQAMREANSLWGHGATESNPGQSANVLQLAVIGAAIVVGAHLLGKLPRGEASAPPGSDTCGGCGLCATCAVS